MLVVSQYESDPRVRRQAEALAARGDDVTVLALSVRLTAFEAPAMTRKTTIT